MTIRETERWLYRAWTASAEIAAKKQQLAEATSQVTAITSQLTGVTVGSTKDPHAKMDRYAILSGSLQQQIDKLMGVQIEITEVIDQVEDDQLRTLLTERYLNRRKWEQISDIMHYSHEGGYVFRLKREAVKAVQAILEGTVH